MNIAKTTKTMARTRPTNEYHVRLLLLLSVGVFACGGDDETSIPQSNMPEVEGSAEPTFWQHVAPILNEKCTACHQTGGIAPFPLDNFEDAERRATLIADMTENRIMPPYLLEVGGSCGDFDESAALTDEEIETIGSWARGERALGTPATMTPPEVPSLPEGLDVFTPEFLPQIEGTALAQFDEYRCFTVDMGLTEEAYVTGYEFEPGNSEIVHHVIAFVVDPNAPSDITGLSNGDAIARLREQDPNPGREGWHCFGAAGDGVAVESSPGGWAPGAGPYTYPEGIGVRVQPDRQLVVQVHYNLARPEVRGQTDRTRVRLRLADSVRRQAGMLLNDAFLGTLRNNPPDVLPPGDPAAKYSWTLTGAQLGLPTGVPVEVLSVAPHMHQRGRKYTVEFGNDGVFDCQGRVNRWDFNWQRQYQYTTPPTLDSASQIRVSCEYDTTDSTEPVLPGWGTRNEMCELTLTVAFPEGVRF
jgi:copper type II ascorbate-dependent monooxygenase-like protein